MGCHLRHGLGRRTEELLCISWEPRSPRKKQFGEHLQPRCFSKTRGSDQQAHYVCNTDGILCYWTRPNNTHLHAHPFNGRFSGTTQVSRYQKRKTNLDFSEARDSEWQWHQLGHMQVCTSHQTDNHASTSPLSFLQAGCPSCRPTNSVKALKA